MALPGRPKAPLVLSDEERSTLERWARRPKSAQALALRCRIVLACATGLSNLEVAARLGVNKATVSKWRQRFIAKRLDGLSDDPRPGAVRTVTDDLVEAVIVKTLEETPPDATHWSTRSMAKTMGMSQSSISRIWRAFGLKPHLGDSFKYSPSDAKTKSPISSNATVNFGRGCTSSPTSEAQSKTPPAGRPLVTSELLLTSPFTVATDQVVSVVVQRLRSDSWGSRGHRFKSGQPDWQR